MPSVRIFVSYNPAGDLPGAECARQLISDLLANGVEVVTDHEDIPDTQLVDFMTRQLIGCQYLILIQTPQALQSLRVQLIVNLALNLVAQQRMKEVLRLIAVVPGIEDEQPSWITPRAFDASRDYARARDKILLDLGLLNLDEPVAERSLAFTPSPEKLVLASATQIADPTEATFPILPPSHSDMPVPKRSIRRRVLLTSILLTGLILATLGFLLVSPLFAQNSQVKNASPSSHLPTRTRPPVQITSASTVAAATPSSTPGVVTTSVIGTAPTATATPASTLPCQSVMLYSFEDGGLDGWKTTGNIQSLQNSTAAGGYQGKHALKVVTLSKNTNDLPFVSVNPTTNQIKSGQLLCAALFTPQGTSNVVHAQLFVQDSKYVWQISSLKQIVPGKWNILSLRVSLTNDPGIQVGIQFLTTPYNTPVTVYIDTVAWG